MSFVLSFEFLPQQRLFLSLEQAFALERFVCVLVQSSQSKARLAKNQGEIPEEFLNKIKNDGSYELGSQINTQG
jgi:hypothetical protein